MRNITKLFYSVVALDNVNFSLESGEVHCILGENGAGKSTLVKILSGLYSDYEGDIFINNKVVKIKNPIDSRNFGIAAIQQHRDLVPTMDAIENIFLGREPYKGIVIDRDKCEKLARNIVDRFDKSIDFNLRVSELTIAQQEIIAITKALMQNCNILLLDEATVPFDVNGRKILFEIIKELKADKHIGIVFISHYIEELFEIGDRITILRDGKKVITTPIKEINISKAISLMIGREQREKFIKLEPKFSDVVLEFKNINVKKYLNNINLKFRKGEILGICGNPDSHKEKIAEVAFGLIKPNSGEIVLNNKKVNIKSINTSFAMKNGIGLLPTDRHGQGLALSRPIFENVTISWLNKNGKFFTTVNKLVSFSKRYIKKLLIKAVNAFQRVEYLSGGNQQKIVIAKWMLTDCDLLFLLDPTAGIDVETRWEIYNILQNLANQGKAVVVISSDLDEILAISNKILIMKNGYIYDYIDSASASKEILLEKIVAG